jgi:hypothetical protein
MDQLPTVKLTVINRDLVKALADALTCVSKKSASRMVAVSHMYPCRIEFPIFALWSELRGVSLAGHSNFSVLTKAFRNVIALSKMTDIIKTESAFTKTRAEHKYLQQAAVLVLMEEAAKNVVSSRVICDLWQVVQQQFTALVVALVSHMISQSLDLSS